LLRCLPASAFRYVSMWDTVTEARWTSSGGS
jgi:hypothetical protein